MRPRVLSLLFRTPYRLRPSVLGWPPRTAWHWRDLLDALGRDDRHLLRVFDLVLVVGFVLVVILALYLFAAG